MTNSNKTTRRKGEMPSSKHPKDVPKELKALSALCKAECSPYSFTNSQKGIATLHVIVMTLFIVMLVLILTALTSSSNVKEQQVLLRDLDLISVAGLQRLVTASAETSWSIIGTQIAFDVLEERLGLGTYWYNGSPGLPPASPGLADQALQAGISDVSIPNNFDVLLREGRVRQLKRNIQLEMRERAISAGWDAVKGNVSQIIRIDGDRPVRSDAKILINISVPIRLQAMVLAGLQALSTSLEARYNQDKGDKILYEEKSRQFNVLTKLNARLLDGARLASQIAETQFSPLELIESDGSSLFLSYDNGVRIFDGRLRARSGLIKCTAVTDEAERNRRELLYNRYAGAIEAARPDQLLPYIDNPTAYIAGAIDAFSGWNPNYNKETTVVSGKDTVGLFAKAGTGEDLFEPHKNLLTGVQRLGTAFRKIAAFGLTGNELLEAGWAAFVDEPATMAALQASQNDWKQAKTTLPPFLISDADNVRAKYEEWKKCNYGAEMAGAAAARYALQKPVDLITTEPTMLSSVPLIMLPPTLAACYGDPECKEGAPGEGFSHAIEILIAPNTEIRAAADGVVTNPALFAQFFPGIDTRSMVAIRHRDRKLPPETPMVYFTVYGNVVPGIAPNIEVKAGDTIGVANEKGSLAFGMFDSTAPQRNSINPCIYLGCYALGQAVSSPNPAAQLPMTGIEILGPLDYAGFLSARTNRDIQLGESFCSLWNRYKRGLRSLAYRFYASDGAAFQVWPAYDGDVVRVESDEEGCGQSIFVKTGDFLTVYGRVNPLAGMGAGSKASSSSPIGAVAPASTCPNPHLRVSFAPLQYTVNNPSDPRIMENPCGVSVGRCKLADVPYVCYNDRGVCDTLPASGVAIFLPPTPSHICSALEWGSIFVPKAEPLLWRERTGRSTFERAGVELNFRAKDKLPLLNCAAAGNDNRTFDLVDQKELLCQGGKLRSCGFDIKGADVHRDGFEAPGVDGYRCVSREIGSPPAFLPDYAQRAYEDTKLSRWCKIDGSDDNDDWFCCFQGRDYTEIGGTPRTFRCQSWDARTFRETGRLVCIDSQTNRCV